MVYKPPNVNSTDFLNLFETTISSLLPTVDHIFCVGDFNIDLLKVHDSETRMLCASLDSLGLYQIIDQPTRIAGLTSTLIDHILVSNRDLVISVNVESAQISDHELISCLINIKIDKPKIQFKTVRNFKNLNPQQFYADLRSIPCRNMYDLGSVDDKVNFLCENINTLLNIHAPYVTHRITKRYAPWFTDTLRAVKKDRDKALSKFKKSREPGDWLNYKTLRNNFTAAVRREKEAFYDNTFVQKNSKTLWANLKFTNINNNNNQIDRLELPPAISDPNIINNY